ncbi:immunoglobulin superfamily containing leucine-rich repeat protein 2-like [Cololabis saira]|uniref:immunoglobulin superfamily containing leucine-rich repeat protein 2-like n=1 Tax=Cololabis saira TaxID=129043 RepID=UPI002AD2624F|nr:immunoglobulin superfamily containing leucine-rich repeat protein 2-like [Cololabis saira]
MSRRRKMAAANILHITLWTVTFFAAALCCPEICSCTDKYGRHFAECSYKDLTEVPDGLPLNVMTVSLSANRISVIPVGSFDNVTQVTSLWLAHNEIVLIEQGSLMPLINLRNFDISHNKIVDFPWEDLQNLTTLQMLKMNHNEMVHLPKDAFFNLLDLRSIRLNNNKFVSLAEGTFDGLGSLSHLQIYNNPFACTCTLDWLRDWIATTTISVTEQNLIKCATPEELKGEVIAKLPESKCTTPNVTIQTKPSLRSSRVYEDSELILTCEFRGNPKPLVVWKINCRGHEQELALPFTEDGSAESIEDSSVSYDSLKVFINGTLLISNLNKKDSGKYSCSAENEFGKAEDSVSVEVVAKPKPTPVRQMTTTFPYTKAIPSPSPSPSQHQRTDRTSIFDAVLFPDLKAKDTLAITPTSPPTVEISSSESYEDTTTYLPRSSKCGLTANTKNISSPVFNRSLDDVKQYTFDFGVIALGVSETEATVRLNPLLLPRIRSTSQENTAATYDSFQTDSGERLGFPDSFEKVHSSGLYLCVTTDSKHSAVQWSRIKEGVNTYLFSGLRPGTNYSLCLTYRGEDCEVQVLFATRRRVPNLLIIISVSICLLTVSTVPLLGATCFHLVYKYRSKTYKLILKAKDQCHMERNLAANLHVNMYAPRTESQRKINGSQLDEEDGEVESVDDGEKEVDTEESVVTESFSLSKCRDNVDDCEVGSEYSDRLPLGAEAVNITSNYNYPNQ